MSPLSLTVNGRSCQVDAEPQTPLLWVLRDDIGLTGTKFGCGVAQCGACTVHVDGQPMRSCAAPVGAIAGRKVTTIEGLSSPVAEAVQQAWIELDVAQCGYCQPGQVMTAVALLERHATPSDLDIDHAMSGNLCRCATYVRIRAAIHHASAQLRADGVTSGRRPPR